MVAANTCSGGDLAGWQVKEIVILTEADPEDGFHMEVQHTSGWEAAELAEDEVRTDSHLISSSAINFSGLSKDRNNTCEFTQRFKKISGTTAEADVPNSCFSITHTIAWRSSQWMYQTVKTGASYGVVLPGEGDARYPTDEDEWARVPGQ